MARKSFNKVSPRIKDKVDYKGDRLTPFAQAKQLKTRGRHLLKTTRVKFGRCSGLALRLIKGFNQKLDSKARDAVFSLLCLRFSNSV